MKNLWRIALLTFFVAASVQAGPVSWYGALQVAGNRIKSADGNVEVQLKGPSLFWSDFTGRQYYHEKTVNFFVDNMDISVIRAAMAIKYYDANGKAIYDGAGNYGYLSSEVTTAQADQKAIIAEVVKAAILNDIYVIIDWHSHTAEKEQADAVAFFTEMATLYKSVPNVIFEVYNEPTSAVSWPAVYNYAKAVIAGIRKTGNNNIILVGSPSWSSNPNDGAGSDLHTTFKNIAYTVHFYAATHTSSGTQRANSVSALTAGAAVFASEWGTTLFSGTGSIDATSSKEWMTWMDLNKVSSCNWSAAAMAELSAMWSTTTTALTIAGLSTSGNLFYDYMKTTINKPRTGYPWGKGITLSAKEGDVKVITLTNLGATSGATIASVAGLPAGMGTVTTNGSSITYNVAVSASMASTSFNYILSLAGKTSKHRVTVNVNRQPIIGNAYFAAAKLVATKVTYPTLAITDPDANPMTFTAVTASSGTVAIATDKKSFTYTPIANFVPAGQDSAAAIVNITVSDGTNTVSAAITSMVKNISPTANTKTATIPNTAPYSITTTFVAANDVDGDIVTFASARLDGGAPGTVVVPAGNATIVYTPVAGLISGAKVIVYFTVTDGRAVSTENRVSFTITGTGSPIPAVGNLKYLRSSSNAIEMKKVNNSTVQVNLAQGGDSRLEILNLQGAHLVSLLQGYHSAGSFDIAIGSLQRGIYFLRLVQGSNAQTMKFVIP